MSEISIAEAMEASLDLLMSESGSPEDIWHQEFGWVLRHGKPTETTEKYYEWLVQNKLIKQNRNA